MGSGRGQSVTRVGKNLGLVRTWSLLAKGANKTRRTKAEQQQEAGALWCSGGRKFRPERRWSEFYACRSTSSKIHFVRVHLRIIFSKSQISNSMQVIHSKPLCLKKKPFACYLFVYTIYRVMFFVHSHTRAACWALAGRAALWSQSSGWWRPVSWPPRDSFHCITRPAWRCISLFPPGLRSAIHSWLLGTYFIYLQSCFLHSEFW